MHDKVAMSLELSALRASGSTDLSVKEITALLVAGGSL